MMRSARRAAVIFVLALVMAAMAAAAYGMGDMGGSKSGKFPTPHKNFKAKITDTSGEISEAELVSCNGKTHLTGYRGETKVEIPFSKIERIRISDNDNRYKNADLHFWNGSDYSFQVKSFAVCQGRTVYGDVTVKIKDIKDVVFEKGEFSETGESETGSKTSE